MRAMWAVVMMLGAAGMAAAKPNQDLYAPKVTNDPFKPYVTVHGRVTVKMGMRLPNYYYYPIAVIERDGSKQDWAISGQVTYYGPVRRRSQAYVYGGSTRPLQIVQGVGSCFSSGCTFKDNFTITLTSEDVAASLAGKNFVVKLSGEGGQDFMLTVPAADIRGVHDLAQPYIKPPLPKSGG